MTKKNPLIESEPFDTLTNLQTLYDFVADYCEEKLFQPKTQNHATNDTVAISLIMKCANKALNNDIEPLEASGSEKRALS